MSRRTRARYASYWPGSQQFVLNALRFVVGVLLSRRGALDHAAARVPMPVHCDPAALTPLGRLLLQQPAIRRWHPSDGALELPRGVFGRLPVELCDMLEDSPGVCTLTRAGGASARRWLFDTRVLFAHLTGRTRML